MRRIHLKVHLKSILHFMFNTVSDSISQWNQRTYSVKVAQKFSIS